MFIEGNKVVFLIQKFLMKLSIHSVTILPNLKGLYEINKYLNLFYFSFH